MPPTLFPTVRLCVPLLFEKFTDFQSVCNRSGLKLAAKTRHITLLLFIVCAPVAWPLSKVVDYVLGREVRQFSNTSREIGTSVISLYD